LQLVASDAFIELEWQGRRLEVRPATSVEGSRDAHRPI